MAIGWKGSKMPEEDRTVGSEEKSAASGCGSSSDASVLPASSNEAGASSEARSETVLDEPIDALAEVQLIIEDIEISGRWQARMRQLANDDGTER